MTMATSTRRKLPAFAVLCVLAMFSGCGGSAGEERSARNSELCEWLVPAMPGGNCVDVDPWKALSSSQAGQKEVDIAWLNVVRAGPDPVQTAIEQQRLGYQAPGRPDLPRWPLTLPISWNADPFKDSNWRFQLNAWRMIDTLILAWLQTGDAQYIQSALDIVDDWYRYHIEQRRSSYYGWGDMATGIRAMKLAWILDMSLRGRIQLDDQRRYRFLALASRHAQVLQQEGFLAEGNHGLFQTHGLLALCKTLPYVATCQGAVAYAERATESLLRTQFTDEGGHREHSPAYHMFVADTVKRMLRSGWYDDFTGVRTLVARVEANRVWLYHPDGKVVLIGDSERGTGQVRFPPGDDACAVADLVPPSCYRLKILRETGYAIARSDWAVPVEASSSLFFEAAFHSPIHKHADDLTFELFEFGELILTDTGKYKYDDDPWRAFAISTRAHNTLEIDGASSSIAPSNAYGSGIKTAVLNDGNYRFVAEAPQADTGRTHRRRIYYTPRRSLLVIDEIEGPAPTSVTQWFHFAPQVQVAPSQEAGRFTATISSGRQIEVEQLTPVCPGSLYRGSTAPFIQGWTSEAYGQLVPRATLGFQCNAPARAYASLFVLDASAASSVRTEALAVLRALSLID